MSSAQPAPEGGAVRSVRYRCMLGCLVPRGGPRPRGARGRGRPFRAAARPGSARASPSTSPGRGEPFQGGGHEVPPFGECPLDADPLRRAHVAPRVQATGVVQEARRRLLRPVPQPARAQCSAAAVSSSGTWAGRAAATSSNRVTDEAGESVRASPHPVGSVIEQRQGRR